KQDALARADEYAHQEAVDKWRANQAFVQQVYNDSMSGQINPYNHTDAQGNTVQFAPPEGHSQALSDAADALNKSVMSNPGAAWNPDIRKQYAAFKQMSANSGAAAVQLATLKQQLAQTSDPDEQKNLQASIDQINKTPPTKMVDAHLPTPKKTDPLPSITDEYGKDYNKAMESFTVGDNDMLGRPTVDFKKIKYAQPLSPEYEAALNGVTQLIEKKDPILTDPTAFAALQEQANDIWENKRGQKDKLNLGKVTPDGTVVLSTSKQGLLDIATALHLQKDGDLWQDPDALSDLDIQEQKAKIASLTGKGKGVKLTAEELKEKENKEAVKSVYNDVQKVLTPPPNTKPLKVTYFGSGYDVYPIPQGQADKYIGIEAPVTTTSIKTGENTVKSTDTKGESAKTEHAFLGINKKTGEREIAYVNGYSSGNPKIIATVPEKQLIVNGLKADAKFEPSQYENRTIHVDEIYRNKGKTDDEPVAPVKVVAPAASSDRTGYTKHVTKKGTAYYTDKDGQKYWENASGALI